MDEYINSTQAVDLNTDAHSNVFQELLLHTSRFTFVERCNFYISIIKYPTNTNKLTEVDVKSSDISMKTETAIV